LLSRSSSSVKKNNHTMTATTTTAPGDEQDDVSLDDVQLSEYEEMIHELGSFPVRTYTKTVPAQRKKRFFAFLNVVGASKHEHYRDAKLTIVNTSVSNIKRNRTRFPSTASR